VLNPNDVAKFDQALAMIGEFYPASLWAMYSGCLERGFSEQQAMSLTVQWLVTTIMRPADPPSNGA
jgi:hypothetical protein